MPIKKLLIATAGAVMSLATVLGFSGGASVETFDEIYVFGDSLSDVGNIYKATQKNEPPNPPYFSGRFSNGPVWVEYLASALKITPNPETNFAFGGATTGDSSEIPLGVLAQIQSFRTKHAAADPNALYIVWAGANDYLRGATDPTVPVTNLVTAVKSLAAAGAKNIAVVNLPDLGKLPGTRTTQRAISLNDLTQEHNSSLAASLNTVRQQLSSDITITYLDANAVFNQVIKTPEQFGFTNVTNPCLSQGSACDRPDDYLFWDDIHPTTAAHKLFVELAFSTLKPASKTVSMFMPERTIVIGGLIVVGLSAGLIAKRQKAMRDRV